MSSQSPRITRHCIRLPRFDYARPCAYFITFCTLHRTPHLATIVEGRVQLTADGQCVARAWRTVKVQYPCFKIVAGVIMPDHVHAIVRLSLANPHALTVSQLVRTVKTHATRLINSHRRTPAARVWQRSFHDRILRTPDEVRAAQHYIRMNPQRWTIARRHITERETRL